MKKNFTQAIKNQRGVTLIELLAVIIILGIIAAIAVPSVIGSFSDAKANADEQNKAIVSEAASRWVLEQIKDGNLTEKAETKNLNFLVTEGYLNKSSVNTNGEIESKDNGKLLYIAIDSKGQITYLDFGPSTE